MLALVDAVQTPVRRVRNALAKRRIFLKSERKSDLEYFCGIVEMNFAKTIFDFVSEYFCEVEVKF